MAKSKKHKRKKNFGTSIILTSVFTLFLGYAVYTSIDTDGFDEEQVYRLNNVSMDIISKDDFSGKIVTKQPVLTISGDNKKVQKMKENNETPEISLDVSSKNKEGIYTITPKLKEEKINVNYTFKPEKIEVKLIESKLQEFNVVERAYNLATDGYLIEKIVANQKATLKVTDEQKLLIGNVIAEVDASLINKSSSTQAKILVLDKKGAIMKNINIKTTTIPVDVTLSKMGWLKIQEDISNLTKEISTLKSELAQKEKQLKSTKDVLRKKDLKKEINFRKSRIEKRSTELESKKSSISSLKKSQEATKKKDMKASLENGGNLEE